MLMNVVLTHPVTKGVRILLVHLNVCVTVDILMPMKALLSVKVCCYFFYFLYQNIKICSFIILEQVTCGCPWQLISVSFFSRGPGWLNELGRWI